MTADKCQVFFIGAGPGDPELMTIKGQNCIKRADLVLYAGSLVPKDVVDCARSESRIIDSSSLNLEQTHALILETVRSDARHIALQYTEGTVAGRLAGCRRRQKPIFFHCQFDYFILFFGRQQFGLEIPLHGTADSFFFCVFRQGFVAIVCRTYCGSPLKSRNIAAGIKPLENSLPYDPDCICRAVTAGHEMTELGSCNQNVV